MLVRVTYNPGHSRQRSQFFWRALGVAAGYQDAAIRIHSLQSPNRSAGVFVSALGHGTGVQDNDFGVPGRSGAFQSAIEKLPLQRCAIGLGRAATKIFYVEAGHAPILNERLARTNRRSLGAPHFQFQPKEVHVKRRILLVDDDLAVLLTLKAVLELQGFEVETAGSSAEAVTRMESGVYQMVISDLRMETEEAGLEVIRTARRQAYNPATALLTAFSPSEEHWGGEQWGGEQWNGERSSAENPGSLLIKPLGTDDLLRQLEALLVRHADRKIQQQNSPTRAQENLRRAG